MGAESQKQHSQLEDVVSRFTNAEKVFQRDAIVVIADLAQDKNTGSLGIVLDNLYGRMEKKGIPTEKATEVIRKYCSIADSYNHARNRLETPLTKYPGFAHTYFTKKYSHS